MDDDASDDEEENDADEEDEEGNPLDMDILDAPTKSAKAKTVADVWFQQDIFKDALADEQDDEEFELERKLDSLQSKGIPLISNFFNQLVFQSFALRCFSLGKTGNGILKSSETDDEEESDEDDDDDEDEDEKKKKKKNKRSLGDDGFEEVPIDQRRLFRKNTFFIRIR